MDKGLKVKTKLGRFRSWDEAYFAAYLNELESKGVVKEWTYEPFPFILTEGLVNRFTVKKVLKTKTKFVDMEQTLLRKREYTPDFMILWESSGYDKLYQPLGIGKELTAPFIAQSNDEEFFSIVEIKPTFSKHGGETIFTNNQKDVWEKYEQFVNLIKINDLFANTFTPVSYTKTPTGKKRALKWKARTVANFLK